MERSRFSTLIGDSEHEENLPHLGSGRTAQAIDQTVVVAMHDQRVAPGFPGKVDRPYRLPGRDLVADLCQTAFKRDPRSASKRDPL